MEGLAPLSGAEWCAPVLRCCWKCAHVVGVEERSLGGRYRCQGARRPSWPSTGCGAGHAAIERHTCASSASVIRRTGGKERKFCANIKVNHKTVCYNLARTPRLLSRAIQIARAYSPASRQQQLKSSRLFAHALFATRCLCQHPHFGLEAPAEAGSGPASSGATEAG